MSRLLRSCLLLVALFASVSSWALLGTAVQYRAASDTAAGVYLPWVGSPAAACSANAADLNAESAGSVDPVGGSYRYTYSASYSEASGCIRTRSDGAKASVTIYSSGAMCPANSTAVTGGCKCDTGYNEVGVGTAGASCGKTDLDPNQLKDDCDAAYDYERMPGGLLVRGIVSDGEDFVVSGKVPDGVFCQPISTGNGSQGCGLEWRRSMTSTNADGSQSTWGKYYEPAAGAGRGGCAVGPDNAMPVPVKKSDGTPCAGYVGTVNGVETCVKGTSGASGVTTGEDSKTKTTDDGTNTTKVDTKTSTSCSGATCTTTSTVTTTVTNNSTNNSTTNTTSTSTTTGKGAWCAGEGKGTAICAASGTGSGGSGGSGSDGSWGGSCTAGFTCEGDAVQCAVAKEQHTRNCELLQTTDPDATYKAAADGTDDKGAEKMKSEASQVSVGSFDQNGLGWGRSCPADPEIPLGFGRAASFSIPFSRVCGPLGILSLAGVGITLLGSMVWMLGGNKSSG